MGGRRRLSSESSFASLSSSSHSLSCEESSLSECDSELGRKKTLIKSKPQSRSLFNDVKVILSKHDRKLSRVEDDLNSVVRWLNEKFGFILKQGSLSSIGSVLEEEDQAGIDAEGDNREEADGSAEVFLDETVPEENDPNPGGTTVGELSLTRSTRTSNSFVDLQQRLSVSSDGNQDGDAISHRSPVPEPTANSVIQVQAAKAVTAKRQRQPRRWKSFPRGSDDSPQLPSQCDLCGKFLKDPNSLRQHKQIHLDVRPFLCPEPGCGKSFRRKFHLQTHFLIHKGVKKHQCGYCGRLFLLQKDLVSHERIHTGERPFKCRDCPKAFSLKSHLVMHVRTHTGEKPYQCEICSKSFSQSNSLRLHKKKVHSSSTQSTTTSKPAPKRKKGRATRLTNLNSTTTTTNLPNSNINLDTSSTSAPIPMPAKLPIYRNQGTSILNSNYHSIPASANSQLVAFLQQQPPIIPPRSFEIIEQSALNNLNLNLNILSSEGEPSTTFINNEMLNLQYKD